MSEVREPVEHVAVWNDSGTIMIKTREPHGDPVEMSEDEALALVQALSRLIEDTGREAGRGKGEAMDGPRIRSLVAMAYVADVAASAAFYAKLGFTVQGRFTPPGEAAPSWLSLCSGGAELMLARASEPVVAAQQAVLFYVYCDDVAAMRSALAAAGLEPGPIATPFYNPKGEFRLADPDGHVVMVAHL